MKKERKFHLPMQGNPTDLAAFPPPITTDPFGSYTGLTNDPDEKPVQDADDL